MNGGLFCAGQQRGWLRGGARYNAVAVLALLALLPACGSDKGRAQPTPELAAGDGGVGAATTPAGLLPELLPLGKSDLTGFAYSRGPGKAAFRRGIEAEKAGDSGASAAAAAEALLADPGHLEAQWLLALSLARLGRFEDVLAPLSAAVAGDCLRWGERSLADDAFDRYLVSTEGARWRSQYDRYRAAYRDLIAESLLVIGRRGAPWLPKKAGATSINHRSELYAWHPGGGRYVRLSRTDASLVAVLRATDSTSLAYVSYSRVFVPKVDSTDGAYLRAVQVGEIDLAQGTTSEHEVQLTDASAIALSPSRLAHEWLVDVTGKEPGAAVQRLIVNVATGKSRPPLADERMSVSQALRVSYRRVDPVIEAVPGMEADWDAAGTASAVRLVRSQKTVTAPTGALFDGRTTSFSPDGTALVLATAALDACGSTPAERLVQLLLIDVATGKQRVIAELEGDPSPVLWQRDRLAYVEMVNGESTVRIVDPASGGEVARLTTKGGISLHRWIEPPACAPVADHGLGPSDEGDHEID